MIEDIDFLLKRLQQHQQRRLLILGGEQAWCYQRLQHLIDCFTGDWIGINLEPQQFFAGTRVQHVKQLLGKTLKHGVIDLRDGVDVTQLAILSGVLKGGSLLVLLTPPWETWAQQPDNTILQWGDTSYATPTPNFIKRMQQILEKDLSWLGWWQNNRVYYPKIDFSLLTTESAEHLDLLSIDSCPILTQEQSEIYQQVTQKSSGYFMLTAARGRGKSTLAGKLADFFQHQYGACWVTSLQKSSAQQLLAQTSSKVKFWAPDELILHAHALNNKPEDKPWLIIEEAASLPLPLLSDLASLFNKILFVTTLQGYEGSGQGFLLKFLKQLPIIKNISLSTPIRWASHDPLEKLINRILLLESDPQKTSECYQESFVDNVFYLKFLTQKALVRSEKILQDFFQLLIAAHYRTTPLDLRRLLDAPYAFLLIVFNAKQEVLAGCWSLNEGNLSSELQKALLVGLRRPRGNLVPQTLLAHGQSLGVAGLAGVRITRLVVANRCRRRGIATQLIQKLITEAQLQHKDYLSACFGYTSELAKFWEQCGFELIHLGTQRETKSGCYSAIFLYPLNQKASIIIARAKKQLQIDWYWLQNLIQYPLPIEARVPTVALEKRDWFYLTAFALGQRTIYATYPNLMRLSLQSPELNAEQIKLVCNKFDKAQVILGGKQALIQKMRLQVLSLLKKLDKHYFDIVANWLFDPSEMKSVDEIYKEESE